MALSPHSHTTLLSRRSGRLRNHTDTTGYLDSRLRKQQPVYRTKQHRSQKNIACQQRTRPACALRSHAISFGSRPLRPRRPMRLPAGRLLTTVSAVRPWRYGASTVSCLEAARRSCHPPLQTPTTDQAGHFCRHEPSCFA